MLVLTVALVVAVAVHQGDFDASVEQLAQDREVLATDEVAGESEGWKSG
jgi:hypothetical protein